jgi:hypothetical protein
MDILQFYAPLVGIITAVFGLGMLFSKVANNTARIKALEVIDDRESGKRDNIVNRLVSLEAKFESETKHLIETQQGMQRELRGLSRQVANLVTQGRPGVAVANFLDTQTD